MKQLVHHLALGSLAVGSLASAALAGEPRPIVVSAEKSGLVLDDDATFMTRPVGLVEVGPTRLCDPELEDYVVKVGELNTNRGVPGWAVVASRRAPDGTLCVAHHSGGFAKSEVDGYAPFSVDTRTNVGSVSKTFLAAAIMQVLQDNCIDPFSDRIMNRLPPHWSYGDGFESVTWAELMQHRSGITQSDVWYTVGVRQVLEAGVVGPKSENYNNVGYGILQLAFARLVRPDIFDECDIKQQNGQLCGFDYVTKAGEVFESWVQKHFFEPNGIDDVSCQIDDSNALAYPVNADMTTEGWDGTGDAQYPSCGRGYLSFSARELWESWRSLHEGDLIGDYLAFEMEDQELGTNGGLNGDVVTPNGVEVIGKGGYLKVGSRGFSGYIAVFPNGVLVASTANGGKNMGYDLGDAYDQTFP